MAVSVASARILIAPSGSPWIASRAVSLASRCVTAAPPSALGSRIESAPAGDNGVEVGVGQSGVERIHPHDETVAASMCFQERERRLACSRLAPGRDRVLEVEDQRVGAALETFCQLALAVGRNEEE